MMQEAATAAAQSSDYGALTGLVQAAGVLVSAGAAIGLTWRRRTQWGPVEQGVPKGAEKFGGLATAIALAILWTQYNGHSATPILRDVAIWGGVGAFVALLVYGILNNVYTYELDTSTETVKSSRKIIGGLWLEKAARKGKANGDTIQDMLKNAAYKVDKIWPRPARAFAQTLFVVFFLVLTCGGTVALSSASMLYLIGQTPAPKVANALKGVSVVILEATSHAIATKSKESVNTKDPTPRGYRILIDDELVGQVRALQVSGGGLFTFDTVEGERKVTITNDYEAIWTCPIVFRVGNQAYTVDVTGPTADCAAGPVSQVVFDAFKQRRELALQAALEPAGAKKTGTVAEEFELIVLEPASVEFSKRGTLKGAPRSYDVYLDNRMIVQVDAGSAGKGARARLTNTTVGEHVVILTAGPETVSCKIAVDYDTLFYAVTSITKNECIVSPVSHDVYTQFTVRTGRMTK